MEKYLLTQSDLCTGCNRCAYICSAVKEGLFQPQRSRIHVSNFPAEGYSLPLVCFQCPKPKCLDACPEGAISKNEQGIVLIDPKTCTGCKKCVAACSYGMIEVNSDDIAFKCDYCGGEPACVEECYSGAIIYAYPDQKQKKERGFQMKHREKADAPETKRNRRAQNMLIQVREAIAV